MFHWSKAFKSRLKTKPKHFTKEGVIYLRKVSYEKPQTNKQPNIQMTLPACLPGT